MSSGTSSTELGVRDRSTDTAGGRRAVVRAPATTVSAVVLATAASEHGGPAAGQPWEGGTLIGRLLDQLASLAVGVAHVVTRPEWAEALRREAAAGGLPVQVHTAPDPSGDLARIAEIAGAAPSAMVVMHGDILCHRQALARLLADPRLSTAILSTGGSHGRPFTFGVRATRGRVVSAASPFHAVRKPTMRFLGVVKVGPDDREALAAVCARLSELTEGGPPPDWSMAVESKERMWRGLLKRSRARQDGIEDPEQAVLRPEDETELAARCAAAEQDTVALVLVGLVRAGLRIDQSYLRTFFWARPLTDAALARARADIARSDEEKLRLEAAVKGSDGFFTTHFVSPYSQYLARWCARRGLTPNQVTSVSMLVGIAAAAAFATGSTAGMVAGAILLQAAFTLDCVDGQLARYTLTFSKLGAWLDSVFDRSKEYVVFAGLAIGASRSGDPAWVLAGAALTLQTCRHTLEFSYAATRHLAISSVEHPPIDQVSDRVGGGNIARALAEEDDEDLIPMPAAPGDATDAAQSMDLEDPEPDDRAADEPVPRRRKSLLRTILGLWRRLDRRLPGVIWVKKMISFPIGERFATISLTAALFGPRTTFIVLLSWGGFALTYTMIGRVMRSAA